MRCLSLLAVVSALAATGMTAQTRIPFTVGPSVALLIGGGNGVRSTDCEDTFFGAGGLNVGHALSGRSIRFQATARGYVLAAGGAICAVAPLRPPNDGTVTLEDQRHLAAHPFGTTDARLDVDLPTHISTVSAGAGV